MSLPGTRTRCRTLVLLLLVPVALLGADCAAMVFRPAVGRFKDGFVMWHDGQFHLCSMYMWCSRTYGCGP